MADSVNGILRKRGDKWQYRIMYYDEYGNRRETSKTFKTKKEAQQAMCSMIKSLEEGVIVKNISVADIYSEFIADCKARCRATTVNRYSGLYNKYLTFFGNKQIKQIKPYQIKHYFDSLDINGTTKQCAFDLFKLIFKYAYKMCYIDNISAIDRLDRPQRDRRNVNVIQQGDIDLIFDYLRNNIDDYKCWLLYNFIYLSVEFGTRRGELCGLTWDCVDYDNKTINIKHNLVYDNGTTYIGLPKTQAGQRVIYISDTAVDIFKNIYSANAKNKLLLGADYVSLCYGGYDLIFRWGNGTAVHPDWFTAHFRRLQQKLGINPTYRVHDLRHFNASVMVAGNIDFKTVQQRLGHSDISTTLKVYAHSMDVKQREAVSVVTDILKHS